MYTRTALTLVVLPQGEAEFGISHKLIMCFVKHLSVESAVEAVGDMSPYFANGLVCGLGADSSEKNNPRELLILRIGRS